MSKRGEGMSGSNYPDDYRFPPDHDPRCEEYIDEADAKGESASCICGDLREDDWLDEGDRRYQEAKEENNNA